MEAEYKIHHILPIVLEGDAKVDHENKWLTYCERIAKLDKQRGQALYLIRGQCMQVLLYNMKHDPDWDTKSESYNPTTLLKLTKKTILAQTKDQSFYATVYDQECALYGFH